MLGAWLLDVPGLVLVLAKLLISGLAIFLAPPRDDVRRGAAWAYLLILVTQLALMPKPAAVGIYWYPLCGILDALTCSATLAALPRCALRTRLASGLMWCVLVNLAAFYEYPTRSEVIYHAYPYLIAAGAALELIALFSETAGHDNTEDPAIGSTRSLRA